MVVQWWGWKSFRQVIGAVSESASCWAVRWESPTEWKSIWHSSSFVSRRYTQKALDNFCLILFLMCVHVCMSDLFFSWKLFFSFFFLFMCSYLLFFIFFYSFILVSSFFLLSVLSRSVSCDGFLNFVSVLCATPIHNFVPVLFAIVDVTAAGEETSDCYPSRRPAR